MVIQNSSHDEPLHLISADSARKAITLVLTHTFVWPFVLLISLMLLTLCRKEAFRTDTRYILFGHSLFVDLMFLLLTDVVITLSYHVVLIPLYFCIPVCMLMVTVTACAPLTITAMCLERYVAICMPLRHNAISTSRRALMVILLIWILSFLSTFVDMLILVSTASRVYLSQKTLCHYQIMVPDEIRRFARGLLGIVGMLVILLIEVVCYVMIFLAARAASGDRKTAKGQRTISLHILQLLLCSAEILCPYIENVALQYGLQTFLNVRLFNFLVFSITSRAVSPLVYGFRDEKFRAAMLYNIRWNRKVTSSDTDK